MEHVFKKILTIIIFSILIQYSLSAEIVRIFEFTEEELSTLKVRKVKGMTTYTLGSNENGNYLRAESEGKGSGLGKEVKIDLTKTPFINITWKIEKILSGIVENWPSPYTKKSIDYVLSTTKEHNDEWVTVKANVKKHFKKLHNLDVEKLNGLAIMTDTDNSKLKAISYYQNIYFSSE